MNSEIEFREENDCISVWYEDDRPPFKDCLMGELWKDNEGYYRFHPDEDAVMTQKHFRTVGRKISQLNTSNSSESS